MLAEESRKMTDLSVRRDAPATHRNRDAILEVLARWLEEPARVLEIASGTGQHAAFFAERLTHLYWQPTDFDPESLGSIEAWSKEGGLGNVAPPVVLDASSKAWSEPFDSFDGIFNANMIHISPWAVAEGLFRGAGHILRPGGLLFLYGPFKVAGAQTSPSNTAFDESLRQRDARWGIRDIEAVTELAQMNRIAHVETNDLPANNKLIVFRHD
jgi:SAM-dependent methyltransferase